MEYIKLNLGKYLTSNLLLTRYTLICIALCSEFINEKFLEFFYKPYSPSICLCNFVQESVQENRWKN